MITAAQSEIAELIPHSGAMCLLEQIVTWDAAHIVCRAISHRDAGNPLLDDGRLWSFCGVEYAAQAMAAHHALIAQSTARPTIKPTHGLLASVRELALHSERLDDIASDLIVRADHLLGEDGKLLYAFTLCADDRELVSGRAAVVLRANA